MSDNRVREQVVNLLTQIAQVIGAESPVQSSAATQNRQSSSGTTGQSGTLAAPLGNLIEPRQPKPGSKFLDIILLYVERSVLHNAEAVTVIW